MRSFQVAKEKEALRATIVPSINAVRLAAGTWAKTAQALRKAEVPMPSGGSGWTENAVYKFIHRGTEAKEPKQSLLPEDPGEAEAQRAEKLAKAEAARQALGPKGTLKS